MKLSIIITTLKDPHLTSTIRSIRETAGDEPEIIVVSDGFPLPVEKDLFGNNVKPIINSERIGVGPSRTLGALHAQGDYILICDSHMRFLPGWYDTALPQLHPDVLFCATCLGLDSEAMDPRKPKGKYCGATIQLFGQDPNAPAKNRVLESTWNKIEPEPGAEICAPMGAAYFWGRETFLSLNPLEHLKTWGSDETAMAIKAWLCGRSVRLMRDVSIGHIFLRGHERQPFKVPVGHVAYNKLWIIETMLCYGDSEICEFLQQGMMQVYGGGELTEARKLLQQMAPFVELERKRNLNRFVYDFDWLIKKFNLV